MSNIHGKVYAMNAITPMKPWKTLAKAAASTPAPVSAFIRVDLPEFV